MVYSYINCSVHKKPKQSSSFLLLMKLIGRVPCSIECFCLTEKMTHSMWIRTFSMVRGFFICNADNFAFPLVDAVMWRLACIIPTDSAMSKPLLAKSTSPWRSFLRILQLYLSSTQPPQISETSDTTPCRAVATKTWVVRLKSEASIYGVFHEIIFLVLCEAQSAYKAC